MLVYSSSSFILVKGRFPTSISKESNTSDTSPEEDGLGGRLHTWSQHQSVPFKFGASPMAQTVPMSNVLFLAKVFFLYMKVELHDSPGRQFSVCVRAKACEGQIMYTFC